MSNIPNHNIYQWVYQQFNTEKIRHSERYRRTIQPGESVCSFFPSSSSSSSPQNETKKASVIFIPDGAFLRKYLTLIEEIFSNLTKFDYLREMKLVLLESAAESMDHRNSSPCVISSGSRAKNYDDESKCSNTICIGGELGSENTFIGKETAAVNERNRIVKLAFEHKHDNAYIGVEVIPFPDLTVKDQFDSLLEGMDDDDFDIFNFTSMNVENRAKCALLRAANFFHRAAKKEFSELMMMQQPKNETLRNHSPIHIIILSEDDLSLSNEEEGANYDHQSSILLNVMNSYDLILFLTKSCSIYDEDETQLKIVGEHWKNLRQRCEDEYIIRNLFQRKTKTENDGYQLDRYGHFEHLSPQKIQEGLRQKQFLKGKLKVTEENCKEAYCTVKGIKGENVTYYLNENNGHFNRTIHNDLVVIQPLPRSQWEAPVGRRRLIHMGNEEQETESLKSPLNGSDDDSTLSHTIPTARVVGGFSSISFRRRQFVATIIPKGKGLRDDSSIVVLPMDNKIPKIRIKTKIDYEHIVNKRLLVEIDSWNLDSMYPSGHYCKIIGDVGDLETEISCLLIEHGVDLSPFSANALACLPQVPNELEWKVSDEEIKCRRDLRRCCRIFSVDPRGCQDIDDAMHARVLDSGDIEVGVHIADVTQFVKLHSALDKEAAKRGTTFYLVDRRFDMLPALLSSNLCSLHGNTDRYAVSVLWTLSPDLETVKSTWYGRTVIHNVQAMTYEQAHNIMHDKEPDDVTTDPPPPLTAGSPVDRSLVKFLKKDLEILTKLARKLRHRRETLGGAVDLSSGERGSELKFELDSNGRPIKVEPKKELEIHHTIAELMIMSNAFVAETIYNHFPDSSILRIHRPANADSFDELERLLKASDVAFDGSSNRALAQTLRDAKAKQSSEQDSLFQSLATRAMSEAQYVCTGTLEEGTRFSHYGLGIEMYCHFTSPIRRYADIAVHHLLLASLAPKHEACCKNYAKLNKVVNQLPESNAISILSGDGLENPSRTIVDSHDEDPTLGSDVDFLDSLIAGAAELTLNDKEHHVAKPQNANSLFIYGTTELSKICDNLNAQNRSAKIASMACQRLFLSLYFRKNVEVTQAVIIDLRQNGLMVYVPKFDMKGPIYLSDRNGCVQILPTMLNLPSNSGLPPSSGFAIVDGYRMFPEATCKMYNADPRVEVAIPGGNKQLVFKPLDVVTVQVSCDLSSSTARIPAPRIHLVSLDQIKRKKYPCNLEQVKMANEVNHLHTDKLNTDNTNDASSPSMFQVISSIELRSDLDETQVRCSSMPRKVSIDGRVQTLKGRLYFGGFKDKTNLDYEHLLNESKELSLEDHAKSGNYDASRRIEREATTRIQRKAAEKRNSRRTKRK